MKTIQFAIRSVFALILAFLMSSASCDLFDKVDDVTFNAKLSHEFLVDEKFESNGQPVSYSDVEILDATKNADFNAHKDKITAIKVNSIKYTVIEYLTADAVTFSNGQAAFTAIGNTSTAIGSASLPFQNIQSAVGQELTLDVSTQGLDDISASLKSTKSVQIISSGTFSKTPVKFSVKVVLDCTITADAL